VVVSGSDFEPLSLELSGLAVTVIVVKAWVVEEEILREDALESINVPTSSRKALSQQSLPSELQHQ
jgi:hypothetical protein